jgi:hypothetical protein
MSNTNTTEKIFEKLQSAIEDLSSNKSVDLNKHIRFHANKGESNYGKGMSWTGQGPVRQFVFRKFDSFWSSEHIDLAKEKSFHIGSEVVLSQDSLGSIVTKSHLQELGRLKGLIVDGSVSINQHLYYDSKTSRLGLGTDNPRSIISVNKDNVGYEFDVRHSNAVIGTSTKNDLSIISSDISRITVGADGNILLGNRNQPLTNVSVHGKLSIQVNNPDPAVDLHVNGPVRLHGRLFAYSDSFPKNGVHQLGDLTWNSNPYPGGPIGWVCIKAGNPGSWASFGLISHLG